MEKRNQMVAISACSKVPVSCMPSAVAGKASFEFNPQPLQEMKQYLEFVSEQWDQALGRLKSFVED
jgi:hypothetical protein